MAPTVRVRRKTIAGHSARQRITVSLTQDKVRFLKAHRGKAGAPSVSAVVEQLIADAQAREQLQRLSAQTALYFDSLSAEEAMEQKAWGELAARLRSAW